jgi:NTP pyrophosphatase (non-canonical NTP hydrolase)
LYIRPGSVSGSGDTIWRNIIHGPARSLRLSLLAYPRGEAVMFSQGLGGGMVAGSLTVNAYQTQATTTDRTRGIGNGFDLAVLGLFGETGSLLSEVKKKQRDSRSYIGYEDAVTEELGDVLWYLAVIANHASLPLFSIAGGSLVDAGRGDAAASDMLFAHLQPQARLALHAPTVEFERTLLKLAGAVGQLAEMSTEGLAVMDRAELAKRLASIFELLVIAADEAGITLETAAIRNLEKAVDRWPIQKSFPPLFDETFPTEEQLPRALTIDIFEREAKNGKHYVVQRCNGIFIGDRLTDNIMKPDDYRFHDAFHYAYAAVLGWSPVTRALFRLKRKSETHVDEGQDGARAILIEEGVATFVFGQAKQLEFFAGRKAGDLSFTFLKAVRQFVRGYESEACPLWLWEEAILRGNEAFRFLRENRRAQLRLDLHARALHVGELPQ